MNRFWYLIFLYTFLTSCTYLEEEPTTLFTLLNPEKTNVIFSNDLTDTEDFNIVEYLNYYNGAGVAAGDINNDGLVDLYFSANQLSNKLFLNKGNFKFKDITESAGVSCPGDWKTGVSMADVNGDGLLDIYVSQVGDYKTVQGENHLYINNGDLTFTDRTEEFGLQFKGFSTQSLFFDYDNDGDIDMFLLNHAVHTKSSYGRAAIIRYTRDMKTGDRLFEQIEKEGKPYFVNVTERAGIFSSRIGYGLGVAAGDVNNDGCIDLYISNDFHENDYLYINNCDGTFTEKIRISVGHTSKSSMGNDMADFNNDGLLDIFTLDMLPDDETILKKSAGEELMQVHDMKEDLGYYFQLTRNCLQLNQSNEMFSEIALFAGVSSTDWSWAPLFFDADNDGYKDLFITNGIPKRPNDLDYLQFLEDNAAAINTLGEERISNATLIDVMPSDTIANYAYKNNHDLTFTNLAPAWGLNQKAFSNGCVYVDLDNDGDLDFVTNNVNSNCFIYRNNAEKITNNNFIKVKLTGPQGNLFGIGTRVDLWINGQLQLQQMMPARGSMSSVDPVLNFGLGSATNIDSLIVTWPGGKTEILQNIASNQTIGINIENASKSMISKKVIPLFKDITDSIDTHYIHEESGFSDFMYQPLLPHKLSTQGPKMAVGDVNGDGMEDLYLCAGAGQPGELMLQTRNGNFINFQQKSFIEQRSGEEIDATFFDADGDSDLDLYIARGSTENEASPELLSDLFYKNDGKGNFTLHQKSIPHINSISSCVKSYDFDQDGDLDLFVGGRPMLSQYGLPGESLLLENNGNGIFTDVSGSIGKEFKQIGMVTDAAWEDIDEDGLKDLIIVGEWMNISIFKNSKDGFLNITKDSGLDHTGGWWNTITSCDIDHDGDVDFIAGNLGLNAKIRGSQNAPATLYAKDFDGNGKIDPIICFYKDSLSVPFPTRDDLITQIPSLKTKFSTYESYAKVRSVEEIFSVSQLSDAAVSNAFEFRTCIVENMGNGKFRLIPLPKEAQLYPVYSILFHDFDRDGKNDLMLAGNMDRANINYGRYDAGYGLFLKGDGTTEFEPKSMIQSGLKIRGEVRDLKIIQTHSKELIFVSKSDAPWQVLSSSE